VTGWIALVRADVVCGVPAPDDAVDVEDAPDHDGDRDSDGA
jgi:hypothetical protein